MKCKKCLEEYLSKTRKLEEIKNSFVVSEGESYCPYHYYIDHLWKHSKTYWEIERDKRLAETQRRGLGIDGYRGQAMAAGRIQRFF